MIHQKESFKMKINIMYLEISIEILVFFLHLILSVSDYFGLAVPLLRLI